MRRALSCLCRFVGSVSLATALCLLLSSFADAAAPPVPAKQKQSASKSKAKKKKSKKKKKGQPVEEEPAQPVVEEVEIPKPPKDDFTVKVYRKMDEANVQTASFKDTFGGDPSSQEVEVVITYFNWSISGKDYWNRQINIDTKSLSGATLENIVKSGFGELGYVPEGQAATQDVYRMEQVVTKGDVATARMVEMEIGDKERDRFRYLMTKFVLEK